MEAKTTFMCRCAALETELKFLREQLDKANATVIYLVTQLGQQHTATQTALESRLRNLECENAHLRSHAISVPQRLHMPSSTLGKVASVVSLQQADDRGAASYEQESEDDTSRSADLLDFDDHFAPSLTVILDTSTGQTETASEGAEQKLLDGSPKGFEIKHEDGSSTFVEHTQTEPAELLGPLSPQHVVLPTLFRQMREELPRRERQRLLDSATFTEELPHDQLDVFWADYSQTHGYWPKERWRTYYEQIIRPEHLAKQVIAKPAVDPVEAEESPDEIEEVKGSNHNFRYGATRDVVVFSPNGPLAWRRSVLVTPVPSCVTLTDVLNKVRGGKILSATYSETSSMKTSPALGGNAVLLVFVAAKSAQAFVNHFKTHALTFGSSDTVKQAARVEIVSTPSRLIPYQVTRRIHGDKASRVIFAHYPRGDWTPEGLATTVRQRSFGSSNPIDYGLDEDGIAFLTFAGIVEACNAKDILDRCEGLDVGFLSDPCARAIGMTVEEQDSQGTPIHTRASINGDHTNDASAL